MGVAGIAGVIVAVGATGATIAGAGMETGAGVAAAGLGAGVIVCPGQPPAAKDLATEKHNIIPRGGMDLPFFLLFILCSALLGAHVWVLKDPYYIRTLNPWRLRICLPEQVLHR